MRSLARQASVASITLLAAAGMAAGCSRNGSNGRTVASCFAKHMPAGAAGSAPGWTLPGGNLQNTRDVASSINSSNVSTLGVAWCVPVESTGAAGAAGVTDGYSTTPVVVNGVVYTQHMESNVMAIKLATGKVLWTHNYSSPNGGPDGVNVASGVVYAATNHAAVALSAATGKQLWSRTLIGNNHEGIDMAPGYRDGTVYLSTVPVNPTVGTYLGGAKGMLWALNARTGAPEWSWDEVQNLWGNAAVNSGGGLWDPPSFDAQGNIYIGIANPGPIGEGGWPKGYPWATSRPGPDLYDWDLQNSPVLTTAHGQPVVIDGGKAGILIELNARTGKLIWKLPVGVILWDDKLPSSPYGAAAVTNDVVFTTTYSGYLYAFSAATGAILLKKPLSAGSNAPVTIDGDYLLAGAGVQAGGEQLIIAYKLGATGKLPVTVGP